MQAAWPIVEPGVPFQRNWHIDVICDHLEAVTAGEIRRLIINIPPRHMKSLAVCVFWPTWAWARRPATKWLFASYAQQLAIRDSVRCRRLLESGWYRSRWGDRFRLTSDQNVKHRFENDQTGLRLATSVGGSATGEGGDVIVIDDPHKIEEAQSELIRQGVIDWHDHTIATRFNNPQTGAEVVIMQRVHEADLAGHLLAKDDWEHLVLPAEYEPSHPFVSVYDRRDRAGHLLWADRFDRQAVDRLKRELGSYAAAGQLQQRPAPLAGGIFQTGWWRWFDPAYLEPPSPLVFSRIVQSWDTSWKEKTTNDYVACSVWGVAGANRYLLRRFRDRVSLPGAIRAVREMHGWVEATFPRLPHHVLVENTANGPDVVAALRNEIGGIVAFNAGRHGDKIQRAHAVTWQIESGNVYLPGYQAGGGQPDPARTPGWVIEFLTEHASFPNGAYDDQVDTTTQALLWLRDRKADLPVETVDQVERQQARRSVTAGLLEYTP